MIKIFRIVKKLFLIPAAVRWVKALDYASKNKYPLSLEYLNKIEKSMYKSPEFHVLKGFVLLQCGDFDRSLKEMELAKEKMTESDKYGYGVKKYMMAYIQSCEVKAYDLKGDFDIAEGINDKIEYDSIELEKVKSALRMNFPIDLNDAINK